VTINREKSKTTDFSDIATGRRLRPIHPGDVLTHDFIDPLGITRYRLAKAMGVPQRRVDEICAGERAITADTALRLERVLGLEARVWLTLQAHYELESADATLRKRIEREATPLDVLT
jgi:addiction module HigA family antidote